MSHRRREAAYPVLMRAGLSMSDVPPPLQAWVRAHPNGLMDVDGIPVPLPLTLPEIVAARKDWEAWQTENGRKACGCGHARDFHFHDSVMGVDWCDECDDFCNGCADWCGGSDE